MIANYGYQSVLPELPKLILVIKIYVRIWDWVPRGRGMVSGILPRLSRDFATRAIPNCSSFFGYSRFINIITHLHIMYV
jgi:hypothetical protein